MTKIIKISNCSECPHEAPAVYNSFFVCKHPDKVDIAGYGMIINTEAGIVPDWCPLEDE